MTSGVTRVYLEHPCGAVTTFQVDPSSNVREVIESELELLQKEHERDCSSCITRVAIL